MDVVKGLRWGLNPVLMLVLCHALQTPSSDFCLPEEDTLLQACRAMLWQRTKFEALDASVAFSELVSNNMLVIFYQRYSTHCQLMV